MLITANRYHDISCGHRVVGHEGKCRHLHGHNYRVHFQCTVEQLDQVGRVVDFSVIKSKLCMWLENTWDHKMLLWEKDPVLTALNDMGAVRHNRSQPHISDIMEGIVVVPFNPTAENIGKHLIEVVGPAQLAGTGVTLTKVHVEETRKCGAEVSL